MADPFDKMLSEVVFKAIGRPGLLEGEGMKVHGGSTVICIGKCPPLPYCYSLNCCIYTDFVLYRRTTILHPCGIDTLPLSADSTSNLLYQHVRRPGM